MREYVGVAFNHMVTVDPDSERASPLAEMVVMTSLPRWTSDISGMHTVREMKDFRMTIGREGLRQMAKFLSEQADVLDQIAADFKYKGMK